MSSVAITPLLSPTSTFREEDGVFFDSIQYQREIKLIILLYLLDPTCDPTAVDHLAQKTQDLYYAQICRIFRESQWVNVFVWDAERAVSDREKVVDLQQHLERMGRGLKVPQDRFQLASPLDLEQKAKTIILYYIEKKVRRTRNPGRYHERIDLRMNSIDRDTQARLRTELQNMDGAAEFLADLQAETDHILSPEHSDEIQRAYVDQQLRRAANLSFPALLWDIKEFGMFVSVITLGPMYYFAFSATAIGLTALALVASAFAVHRLIRWACFP